MYSKGIPVIAVKLLIGEEKTEKTVNIGDTLTDLTIANPNGEDIVLTGTMEACSLNRIYVDSVKTQFSLDNVAMNSYIVPVCAMADDANVVYEVDSILVKVENPPAEDAEPDADPTYTYHKVFVKDIKSVA